MGSVLSNLLGPTGLMSTIIGQTLTTVGDHNTWEEKSARRDEATTSAFGELGSTFDMSLAEAVDAMVAGLLLGAFVIVTAWVVVRLTGAFRRTTKKKQEGDQEAEGKELGHATSVELVRKGDADDMA